MPEPGGVLFFDLAARCGWAYARDLASMPTWGVWLIPIERGFGHAFNAWQNCVYDMFDEFQPARVGVERPIPQRGNNVVTAELTYGLHSILALACHQHEKPLSRPAVNTIRAKVIGRCSLDPFERAARQTVKTAIVEPWARSMGWGAITSPDARDAACGLAFELGHRAARPVRAKAGRRLPGARMAEAAA